MLSKFRSRLSYGNVVATIALFVALGGTAAASVIVSSNGQVAQNTISGHKAPKGDHPNLIAGSVNGQDLSTRAVSAPKIGTGAVTNSKLGANAVTSSKVQDNSLTGADINESTLDGSQVTGVNASQLGGLPAGQYVQGRGSMVFRRVQLAAGSDPFTFLSLGFGHIQGTCTAGGIPKIRYVSDVAQVNLVDWVTNFGGTTAVNTTNGLTNGGVYEEPHSNTSPQSITWQSAYNDGTQDHVATAWTTGQDIGTTSCIFIGQGTTTG